jgi:capsular polysaccharide biosynthesis protein
MNQQQNNPDQQEIVDSDFNDDEIDILGLIQTLGEEKWLLLGLPFICACIAAVISLYLTPIYSAKATFIVPPDKSSSSTSAVLDQLGGLGGLAGGLGKSTSDMYVAFLQSESVQDVIIAEFDLRQRYKTKTQDDARRILTSRVQINTDKKSGLIYIVAQDQSQDMAAQLANAHLKPFRALLNRMSLEEAHLRRDFFAQQIGVIAQRPFRDPFIQSSLMNSLIKQYEMARLDEARESQVLFPLDVAKTPESRSSPKRALLVINTGASIFFLTLLWVFIKRALLRIKSNPGSSQKWAIMIKAWKLRPSKRA